MKFAGPWGWADAHSHLSDPRMPDAAAAIQQARDQGLKIFLQGGVGPEDWARQKQWSHKEIGFLPTFGLHPYWVAEHTDTECEQALDLLAKELRQAAALGETGLDFRPHIMNDSASRQMHCFEAQLELARMAHLPVVLHIVRAFEESLRALDHFGAAQNRGLVHAFTGSVTQAQAYLERGLLISVGGALCREGGHARLEQAVAAIPLDRLLVETDSPDQPPAGVAAGKNTPTTVLRVADEIARIHKVTRVQVLDKTSENLRKLLNA